MQLWLTCMVPGRLGRMGGEPLRPVSPVAMAALWSPSPSTTPGAMHFEAHTPGAMLIEAHTPGAMLMDALTPGGMRELETLAWATQSPAQPVKVL